MFFFVQSARETGDLGNFSSSLDGIKCMYATTTHIFHDYLFASSVQQRIRKSKVHVNRRVYTSAKKHIIEKCAKTFILCERPRVFCKFMQNDYLLCQGHILKLITFFCYFYFNSLI